METYRNTGSRLAFVLLVGGLLFLMALPMWVQAAPSPLPTRPIPTDTPTPTLTSTVPISGVLVSPESSTIVLVARAEQATRAAQWRALWTWVEWQDGDGAWQEVVGWRGALDSITAGGGRKAWSVPPSLFGHGPFRWGVAAQRGGTVLVYSAPFDLPERAGQTLEVAVTLDTVPQPILLPMTGVTLWRGVLMGLVLLVGFLGMVRVLRRLKLPLTG